MPTVTFFETARTHVVPPLSTLSPSGTREYVITAPTGFTAAAGRYKNRMLELWSQTKYRIIDSIHEDSDKLAELTEEEVTQLKTEYPGVVVEPNIPYKKTRHPFFDDFQEINIPASAATKTVTIQVVDDASGQAVPDVTLYLVQDEARRIGYKAVTNAAGDARFVTPASAQHFDSLAALPLHSYWNRRLRGPTIDFGLRVALQALPAVQPEDYDWGQTFARMRDGIANGGAGVKIAVVDSGIRRDHPDLHPAGGRNCVLGEDVELWYDDDDGHGTHCAGVIAALVNGTGIKGYAPNAQVYAYRVFGKDAPGAMTFDIVKAIERAVDDGCDIISMSLGSPTAQSAIRAKTEMAYDRGVLCLAATGNEGGAVSYPAAFPSVLGVGAFGRFGGYPADSLHHETESAVRSANAEYFMADFSNFGNDVDFCAPGVAVRSTVPGGYSAWDGTSMACPQVAGIAALLLAASPAILAAPRDAVRVDQLVQTLKGRAQPLGFGLNYEGVGCLTLP
jgi:subtilisin